MQQLCLGASLGGRVVSGENNGSCEGLLGHEWGMGKFSCLRGFLVSFINAYAGIRIVLPIFVPIQLALNNVLQNELNVI
ncbi:hypothetical protein [Hahella ganghwensis]|uniref:hypothetical protein n=1 Tax=Hahella ganghwensis TaxID=286420 RepID=UPI0012FC809D|nr:hypothetical protein [Hahella ganghwensis]